MSTENSKTQKE
jgi:hypothetical protein